jgi:fructose-bisphosphate aldolase class II
MLVTVKQLLKNADKGGYAVGAFNTLNLEITKAIVQAAEDLKSPVIISTSEGEINYAGLEFIPRIVHIAAHNAKVPVALHLDHGASLKMALMCIKAGYTSVHIDGSGLPYDQNTALTLSVAEIAHREGVSVEGELGHIEEHSEVHKSKIKDLKIQKTNSDQAKIFIKETGIDSLAVCIGNAHGLYEDEKKLDFDLLKKIRENVKIPLVLHGGSGIPEKDIKKAIKIGVRKININTELRLSFTGSLREALDENPDEVVPYKIFPKVIQTVKRTVEEKIKLFGSRGKA